MRDSSSARSPESSSTRPQETGAEEKVPWLVLIFCVLLLAIPAISVLPGPLRSNGSPARMIGFLCFLLVVAGFLLERRGSRVRGMNPGAVVLVVYFFVQLLTFGTGLLELGNTVIETSKTREALTLVANVGIGLYILRKVVTGRQRSLVLGWLVAGLSFTCLVGVLQSFTSLDLRLFFVPPGFVQVKDAGGLALRGGVHRVVGTADHPIEFAVLAAIAVPLSLHLARFADKPRHRQLAAVACFLAFLAVPAAVSRSGVLTLAVAMLVYLLAMNIRSLGNVVLIGLAATLAYRVVSPSSLAALWTTITNSETDESILTRTEDYAAVGDQFRRDPWFGLGLGGYPPTEYRFLDNQWLQAIVQGGIVGVAALLLFTVGSVAGFVAALRCVSDEKERDRVYAIGGALVGVLVSSTTFDLFSFRQAGFITFVLFALLWSYYVPQPGVLGPSKAWLRVRPRH